MAYVITKKCLGERYALCATVCPVDCIYPGEKDGLPFMVIDPVICIDCGACLPECPVDAIVDNVDDDPEYTKINADLAPVYKNNPKVQTRPADDPPKMPYNQK